LPLQRKKGEAVSNFLAFSHAIEKRLVRLTGEQKKGPGWWSG